MNFDKIEFDPRFYLSDTGEFKLLSLIGIRKASDKPSIGEYRNGIEQTQ